MVNLYNGDCLEVMKDIPDKSVDMILCDLPYGTTACKWDIIIPFEELWEQYNRIIKDNGAIVLFGNEPFSSYLRMSNIKNYRYDWKWEKEQGTGFANSKKMPLRLYENISVFYKKLPQYTPPLEKLDKPRKVYRKDNTKSETARMTSKEYVGKTVIYYYKTPTDKLKFNRQRGLHPTQKPVALLEYLIKTYTTENEIVLDNCMGSGSTGVACINTNRRFIGIEKDKNYFDIAEKRIKEVKKC